MEARGIDMEYFLTSTPIPGMILWFVLYISDYYMTLSTARGFKEMGVFSFEKSFELTPQFQKDINAHARISRRHLIYLIVYTLIIPVFWFLGYRFLGMDWLYSFLIGALLLLETAVHIRHFRNLNQIRVYKKEGGLQGKILFGQRFSYRISAFDLYTQATLFLLVALLTFSPFFLGGAFICFLNGVRHGRYARKTPALPNLEVVTPNADSSSR